MRQALLSDSGLKAIVRPGLDLDLAREVRTDQYGIRTMLNQGEVEIKFEIIFESRIPLEAPAKSDKICGLSTLAQNDMATSIF